MPDITRIFQLLDAYRLPQNRNALVFTHTTEGQTTSIYGGRYIEIVEGLALGLLQSGITKGSTIATVMSNRPEWNYFDMALLSIGAIQVPLYPTAGFDNCAFIFNDAAISMLIIENEETLKRMKRAIGQLPDYVKILTIDKVKGYKTWDTLLANTMEAEDKKHIFLTARNAIEPSDVASIIYTSGTTGNPKGVMLSHQNFVSNFLTVAKLMPSGLVKSALSFLPLCHVYERMLNYLYQYLGIVVHYARGPEFIREDLTLLKPEMVCVVPRVLEKMYVHIMQKGRLLKGMKRILYFWSLSIATHYKIDKRITLFYRIRHRIADRLVYTQIRKNLGGNLKVIISGGAALHPKLLRVFKAFGFFVLPGYGLTETSPVIAVTTFEKNGIREGTVGPVLENVKVKIASDHEILVKGPNVMLGYYNNPQKTREVIDEEGWFHTGDTGEIVQHKFLKINDRIKEIFKTSGGKYVAPQSIENKLRESPFIENIMIFGENRNFPSAIIAPNFEHLEGWAKHKEIDFDSRNDLISNPIVQQRISRDIETFSEGIDHSSKVKKFILTAKKWTPESGYLTPTLKLKRKEIEKKYRKAIEKLYKP
ncbi:MAG: long-chain fatty acid--CoA ligase [Bacteroidia bacterium]|nr:long-chain fatty acid--CoA ligase [Bacteroidia bacterium]